MIRTRAKRIFRHITPVRLAVAMALLLILWLLLGDTRRVQETAPPAPAQNASSVPRVETRWSTASATPREQIAHGQLQPWQSVRVMAQVSGRVERLVRQQGERVAAGDVLLELTDEGRGPQLTQATANLRVRQRELDNAKRLRASDFVTETDVIRVEGELARAQAELQTAELAVQYNRPIAPFAGVVDRRYVELGELVQPGGELVSLVNVERLKATAQIPQQNAGSISPGQPVRLVLFDGRELAGEVRFISMAADPETRSFYVEVEAQNPELWRVAGASVTLRIQQPPVNAHRLSPALLSLGADGQLGVHAVDDQDRVIHYPVRVVSIGNDAAVVEGLPERVQLITMGAGFAAPGQQVHPVAQPEGAATE